MEQRHAAKGKVLRSQFGSAACEIFLKLQTNPILSERRANTRLELGRRGLSSSSIRVGDGTKASSRRLVDVGAAGAPALLTPQPFAEFGDPEVCAQVPAARPR